MKKTKSIDFSLLTKHFVFPSLASMKSVVRSYPRLSFPVMLFMCFAIFQTLNLFDIASGLSAWDSLIENCVISLFWPLAVRHGLDWLAG